MQYKLSASIWGSQTFAVPTWLIDRHLKLASPLACKALLALLRDPEMSADINALAKRIGDLPENLSDALSYWVESGVLLPEEGVGQARAIEPVAASAAPPPQKAPVFLAPPTPSRPASRPRYPRDEAISLVEGDKGLTSLLQEAQAVMGKTFTSADMDVLLGLFSFYGLTPHYIITLLHYCVLAERRSMAYAESTAVSWLAEGVDDASVDAQVDRLMRRRSNEGRVRAAFGIGDRRLVPREREMIARWFDEWGFELEMVNLAYEIAVERTGKLAFQYINKILSSWQTQGVKTPEQAKKESAARQPSAKNESDLDRMLLERFMKE